MKLKCSVCNNYCSLNEGQYGKCKARYNKSGAIIPGNYGRITSISLDPIEKKPLRNFYPGSRILSVGSYGCNLNCDFCQNYMISAKSQSECDNFYMSPKQLTDKAEQLKKSGNIGVAFTYNEPLIGYEYVRDTAMLVKERNMVNVLVTNGFFTKKTLNEVLPFIDAMNIDLKGFSKEYYEFLGGDLEVVRQFIMTAVQACHVELTTLIVPGKNDREDEMHSMAQWIASLNRDIPLHVSRFFPAWRMQEEQPTPVETVYRLAEIAREYLTFVYEGNC